VRFAVRSITERIADGSIFGVDGFSSIDKITFGVMTA
jgi:hypothetical protein